MRMLPVILQELVAMDARTGPKIRTGPDKLRGPDFSVRIFLVRSVVRIFWSGLSVPVRIFVPVRILVRIFEIVKIFEK